MMTVLESKRRPACFQLPRLLFGGMEMTNSSTDGPLSNDDASIWNRTQFETLRWHYHADWNDIPRHPLPKPLLDWRILRTDNQQMNDHRTNLLKGVHSIHRPVRSQTICPRSAAFDQEDQDVAIHHYLGSAERFLARDDVRRTKEVRTKSDSFPLCFPSMF
jgi:hypothetical protein